MRALLFALLLAWTASAQRIIDPARMPGAVRDLDAHEGDRLLRCTVDEVKPTLNFGFRFQAGYVIRVPLNQYSGAGHWWGVLTQLTPQDGNPRPVYLVDRFRLPPVPQTEMVGQVGGWYLLGEGRYRVKWLLMDDSGRVCRKEWEVEAKLSHGDRNVKVALPPDTVSGLSLRGAPRPAPRDDVAPLRLTVMLDATPVFPRRTVMNENDRGTLLGILAALVERVAARSVRLVVFNLDQQRELYRQDGFGLDSLYQVSHALSDLQTALVDYHVLQNRAGHLGLLADLLNHEMHAAKPSDAVVFLGPKTRYDDKMPAEFLDTPPEGAPRFFDLEYQPFRMRLTPMSHGMLDMAAAANLPDSVAFAVQRLKGKAFAIRTPADFEKAIEQVEKRTRRAGK